MSVCSTIGQPALRNSIQPVFKNRKVSAVVRVVVNVHPDYFLIVNAAGALHWGINYAKPSDYLRRVLPNWEEPPKHMDLATFDTTVKVGNTTLIDNGFLMALRSPQVVAAASRYGDPVELLEAFVE